jgi:hypothetical protein
VGDERVVLPSLLAGLVTWNFVMSPHQPWHRNVVSQWLWDTTWAWWGGCVLAIALPIAVAACLTRPDSAQ